MACHLIIMQYNWFQTFNFIVLVFNSDSYINLSTRFDSFYDQIQWKKEIFERRKRAKHITIDIIVNCKMYAVNVNCMTKKKKKKNMQSHQTG